MQNFLKNIPESTKKMISVVTPLIALIILFVIVGKFGWSKVGNLRSKIVVAQKDETVLTQKAKLLETISDTLSSGSAISTAVMPQDNSALVVLTQLKILSGTRVVFLSNVKSGAEVKDESGLSRVDITFDLRGTKESVIAFLKDTGNLAPIVKLNKIKISQALGETLATVSVMAFWSELPKTIPSVTDGISDLTPKERATLTEIGKLIQPMFTQLPAAEGGKTDPFGI